VAIGADFDTQHVALNGGTSGEIVAASAVNGYIVIIGMNTGFHGTPFLVASGLRHPCMRRRRGVARTRGTSDYKTEGEFRQMEEFDAGMAGVDRKRKA
jgi:hypothetical protein